MSLFFIPIDTFLKRAINTTGVSYSVAEGNKFKGGGYEDEAVYNCKVEFCKIGNIHHVRNCYEKMAQIALRPDSAF